MTGNDGSGDLTLNLICPGCGADFRAAASEREVTCPQCGEVLAMPGVVGMDGRKESAGRDDAGRGAPPDPGTRFKSTEDMEDPNVEEFVGEDGQVRRKRRVRKRKRKAREVEKEDWEKRKVKHRRSWKPVIAWVGLVILVLAVLVWGLRLSGIGRGPDVEPAPRSSTVLTDPEQGGSDEVQSVDIPVRELEGVVQGFLKAKSVKEMALWVRDPQRVYPLMTEFYARDGEEFRPVTWKAIGEDKAVSVLGSMTAVLVTMEDFSQRQVAMEKTSRGFLVDWESWVGYSEMPWKEFQRTRPAEPLVFRVRMERVPYYNFGFSDDRQWISYRLLSPDDDLLWGYASADSAPIELSTLRVGADEKMMTLRLHYPENSTRADQVVIDELVVKGWVIH